ncbi:MAG: hypothetical protein ACRDZ3_10875 [Acidimicrobiia bacterium]
MSITKNVKEELGRRVATASEEEFLEARFRPLVELANGEPPGNGHGGTGWAVRTVQLDSTGAATVEIRRNGGRAVFAKFFPPGTDGEAIHDKLRTLREAGFGAGAAYQVVEPLAWVPDLDLLVCAEAIGPSVADVLAGDDPAARRRAVEEAATWLGHLHSTPLRIGRPHSMIVSTEILSLTRRLAKVATEHADYVPEALRKIEQLEALALETVDGLAVQSHGQYRPIHVFLGPGFPGAPGVGPGSRGVPGVDGATTVIDLDRSRPADPARDTAEFLHRLRRQLTGDGRSDQEVEATTAAFLDAYRAAVPDPEAWLANLRFHWARYVFHSMNRKLKKGDSKEDEEAVDTYRADFDALIEGRLLPAG